MVARPWSSSRLSCGERLLLRCARNARNSFLTTQGKDPSSRASRRKRGSSGCGRVSGCWTGVSTPPTTETHCEGGPSSSRYCGLQIKEGGRRKPHLHKRKMGCLSSENNFSMKFPKKIPLAENKHWKSFQISVRSLSLSLSPCLPGPALSLFVVEVEESQPCGSQSSLH